MDSLVVVVDHKTLVVIVAVSCKVEAEPSELEVLMAPEEHSLSSMQKPYQQQFVPKPKQLRLQQRHRRLRGHAFVPRKIEAKRVVSWDCS